MLTTLVLSLLILSGIVAVKSQRLADATCDDDEYECTKCYNLLVWNVLKSSKNRYDLTRAFFPPDTSNPVSVIVYYDFKDENGDIDHSKQQLWFWSTSSYYHFQPLSVLQYTSLFFTDISNRIRYLYITLDIKCSGNEKEAGDYRDMMQLLTQRLKLYAMEHSISPKITDTYDPKAENIYTLMNWLESQSIDVTQYLLIYQGLFPLFILVSSLLAILYFLYAKPHSIGERINTLADEFEMRANLYIVTSMSIMFSAYVITMSIIAYSKGKDDVHKEFNKWFENNDTHFQNLFSINAAILVEDISFSIFIFDCVFISIAHNAIFSATFHWELHVFFLLLPITTVAVHGNHILIGFIHTPYHATGVGTLYGIVIVTCIAILKIIYHLLYLLFHRCENSNCGTLLGYFCILILSVVVIGLTVLGFASVIALYYLLPINTAIDEAPNRLTAIYQGLVVVFAGFVTYWIVIRRNKSPLSPFIRVKDSDNNIVGWSDVTYKQKEEAVARTILNHYGKVTLPGGQVTLPGL